MVYASVVTLREGLEAALIIGILLAYLDKSRNPARKRSIWAGTFAALAVSLLGGLLLYRFEAGLSGKALEAFEGVTMLLAAAILSGMIITMQRTASSLKGELTSKLSQAAASGSDWGLAALAFTVVGREGIETVLFLVGGASSAESGTLYLLSGAAGGAVAAVIGWGLYRGSLRLNLRRFFTVSGLLLIVLAAGLVANGIKELHEAGWIPPVIAHIWDTYHLLSDTTVFGKLLSALTGYDSSPSLMQVVGYGGYLLLAGGIFVRGLQTRTGSLKKKEETVS